MDKKMTMISALESHYKALMDRIALDINALLDGGDSESLDLLAENVKEYSSVLNEFNFVQKLKEKSLESAKKDEK
jgi:hypothetical protein